MNSINSNDKDFCFLLNIKEYLEKYGFKRSLNWISGLVSCYGFSYVNDFTDENIGEFILGRSYSFEKMFQIFIENISNAICVTINTSIVYSYIKNHIDNCIDILIWVNDRYLNYSPYYNKVDFFSLIIVKKIGLSTTEIFDSEMRVIDTNILIRAANCNDKTRLVYIQDKIVWLKNEFSMMKNSLNLIVDSFNTKNLEYKIGNEGIFAFINDISVFNKEQLYKICYEMNRACGPKITRRNMRNFLHEFNNKYDVSYTNSINLLSELEQMWTMTGNLIYKLSVTLDLSLRQRIIDYAKDIIKLENSFLQMLKNEYILNLE